MKVIAQDSDVIMVLTKQEAVEIIALLAAQIADVNAPGVHAGACPTFYVGDQRYSFCLADNSVTKQVRRQRSRKPKCKIDDINYW